jgi:hypothetical protein
MLVDILTISSRSDMIAPNVIDITGPMSGDTSIAATIFEALFSINPRAAKELEAKKNQFGKLLKIPFSP